MSTVSTHSIIPDNNSSLFPSSSNQHTTSETNLNSSFNSPPLIDSTQNEAQDHKRRHSYSQDHSDTNDNNSDSKGKIPLSMRFIHKPSRSNEEFIKSNDPTRRNSLLNEKIESPLENDEIPPDYFNHKHKSQQHQHFTYEKDPDTSSPSSINTPRLSNDLNLPDNDYSLVRKKSGELVKPSLKSPAIIDKKRSMSLPTTPTYKQVHFGGSNDVRYFKQKDRPTALSATNSPTFGKTDYSDDDTYLDDDRYSDSELETVSKDFHNFSLLDTHYPNKNPTKPNWELILLNFPPLSYAKKVEIQAPVFLEKLFISNDKKFLYGYIAVKNFAFDKFLTVRYSLDKWQTIIEIPTHYVDTKEEILHKNNYDRFNFKIPLNSLFNSFKFNSSTDSIDESKVSEKSYQLCIKYCCNNQEYWDNNNFQNYHIKLKKSFPDMPVTPSSQLQTNIQKHSSKPKYSSSYKKKQSTPTKHDDNEDYISNNFYISSPLLSSIHKQNQDEEFLKNTEDVSIMKTQPKYKEIFKNQLKNKNFSDDKQTSQHQNNSSSSSGSTPSSLPKTNKFLNSKSYKELLENYCFFNDQQSNDNHHETEQKKKNSFSVSSFLGT